MGFYKAIYGIKPLYNWLYLNLHRLEKLSGTELIYNFRRDKLKIRLAINNFNISNKQFKVTSKSDFGFFSEKNELLYFNKKCDLYSLKALTSEIISLEIGKWDSDDYFWIQTSAKEEGNISYVMNVPCADSYYTVLDGDKKLNYKSDMNGELKFVIKSGKKSIRVTRNLNLPHT